MGYHQLDIKPNSRGITTFATHSGLYRYETPLFGVNSASEVFQYTIASALAGTEGATNVPGNIVVYAADKETHDKRLRQVLGVIHNCHHFHERTQRTLGGGGQGRPYAFLNDVF